MILLDAVEWISSAVQLTENSNLDCSGILSNNIPGDGEDHVPILIYEFLIVVEILSVLDKCSPFCEQHFLPITYE